MHHSLVWPKSVAAGAFTNTPPPPSSLSCENEYLNAPQIAFGWLYIQFEQSESLFLLHYFTTRGQLIPQACSGVFDKLLQR